MPSLEEYRSRSWREGDFCISTDSSLVPIQGLIDIFSSDDFYWAKPMPHDAMQDMLQQSLCFSIFQAQKEFVGFARCITDFATFVYLTDVWVKPSLQGRGLGKWLISCVREVVETMPHLRRALLFTADWERSVPFYERTLGMSLMHSSPGNGLAVMECKGRGHPSYGSVGSGYSSTA